MFEKANGELTEAEDSSQLSITDVDENAIPTDTVSSNENADSEAKTEAEADNEDYSEDMSAEDDIIDID